MPPVPILGALEANPDLEDFENVEPSAQFSDVTLLIGCFAAIPVRAQNLEAGKSPSQIFSGTCTACHKAPRGLFKTVPRRIVARLPAPALHHFQRDGLATQRLFDCQRGDRTAVPSRHNRRRMQNLLHPSSSTVSAVQYARCRRPRPPGPKLSRNRPRSLPAPMAASQRPSRS